MDGIPPPASLYELARAAARGHRGNKNSRQPAEHKSRRSRRHEAEMRGIELRRGHENKKRSVLPAHEANEISQASGAWYESRRN